MDSAFEQTITQLAGSPHGKYLVAEDQSGRIVGHAVLSRMGLERVQHVTRLTMVVHEGQQGKGIGSRLMEELIVWAKSSPAVEKIELHVRATNSRAIALYKRFGFQEEGRFARRVRLARGAYIDDIGMGLWVGGED